MKDLAQNPWFRWGAVVALMCVLAFGWFWIIYRPAHLRLAEMADRRRQLHTGVDQMVGLEQQMRSLRTNIDSLHASLHEIEARLVDRDNLDELIQRLARKGRAVGMPFVSVAPDYEALLSGAQQGPILPLKVEIEAEGRFLALGRFLDDLGNMPFYFEPVAVSMRYDPLLYPRLSILLKGQLYLRAGNSG